jgi:hypothetical protein
MRSGLVSPDGFFFAAQQLATDDAGAVSTWCEQQDSAVVRIGVTHRHTCHHNPAGNTSPGRASSSMSRVANGRIEAGIFVVWAADAKGRRGPAARSQPGPPPVTRSEVTFGGIGSVTCVGRAVGAERR